MGRYKLSVLSSVIVLTLGLFIAGVALYINNRTIDNVNFQNEGSKTFEYIKRYDSKGGIDEMKIAISLSNDTIEKVVIDYEISNRVSANYLKKFTEGIPSKIVGKKITGEFDRSTVNGSSVTTKAFWEAFDSMKPEMLKDLI